MSPSAFWVTTDAGLALPQTSSFRSKARVIGNSAQVMIV